jgi:hypothetical protein
LIRARSSGTRRASLGPRHSLVAAALGLLLSSLAPAACGRSSGARAVERRDARDATTADVAVAVAAAPAPPRLPEDREAGEKSHQQWLKHLQFEERERQLGYDRRKLKEHRALIAVLEAARKRYDAARTLPAIEKLQARTPALAEDVRTRMIAIDQWGVNSRLGDDYKALLVSLSETYPTAAKAALRGDRRALDEARGQMDRHLRAMRSWLREAADSHDE